FFGPPGAPLAAEPVQPGPPGDPVLLPAGREPDDARAAPGAADRRDAGVHLGAAAGGARSTTRVRRASIVAFSPPMSSPAKAVVGERMARGAKTSRRTRVS